jgi:hypothetical protein
VTLAHLAGLPVEESVRLLAPAAATIVYLAAWLRHR